MILCYFLKLLSECSLYFVLANCFLSIAFTGINSLIPAILCALCGCCAFRLNQTKKKGLRYLALPLLLLNGFFVQGIGTAMVLFLPCFYLFMLIKEEHFFLDSEQQAFVFRWGLVASFLCFFLFGSFIGLHWVVPFILTFLFSSSFLMRLLRQNQSTLQDKRYLLHTAFQLGATLAAAALLTTETVLQQLQRLWAWFYSLLLEPISFYFAVALTYIGTAVDGLFQSVFTGIKHKEWHYQGGVHHRWHDEVFYQEIQESMSQESPAVIFLQICCLIIGICVVLAIIRWRRKGEKLHRQTAVKETRRTLEVQKKEEKPPMDLLPPKEPRLAVRYYYRRFLYLCKKLEYQFPVSFTSQKIEESVRRQFGADSPHAIRQTYIRARYSNEEVSEADVALMKEQVNRLREKYEPKKKENS